MLYGGWRHPRLCPYCWSQPKLGLANSRVKLSRLHPDRRVPALGSLVATLLFLQVWRPQMPNLPSRIHRGDAHRDSAGSACRDDALVIVTVTYSWTYERLPPSVNSRFIGRVGQAVSITLYHNKPYAASDFPALGTEPHPAGALITALLSDCRRRAFRCVSVDPNLARHHLISSSDRLCVNYSVSYTLGWRCVDWARLHLFSPSWMDCGFLSAAITPATRCSAIYNRRRRQLQLNPLCSPPPTSGVLGKMISPQNIATGYASRLEGKEERCWRAPSFTASADLVLVAIVIVHIFVPASSQLRREPMSTRIKRRVREAGVPDRCSNGAAASPARGANAQQALEFRFATAAVQIACTRRSLHV